MDNEKVIEIKPTIQTIKVVTDSLDVEIETIDMNNSINQKPSTVTCKDDTKVEFRGDWLVVEENASESVLKKVKNVIKNRNNTSIIINNIKFFSTNDEIGVNNGKIKFVLDKQSKFKFTITTGNGNVKIKDLITPVLDIHTSSGNVEINNSIIGKTAIQTASGDVDINEMEAKNSTLINTLSGNINLTSDTFTRCQLMTTSGDVDVENVNVSSFDVSGTSGDVVLKDIEALIIEVMCTRGDIELQNTDALNTIIRNIGGNTRVELLDSLLNYKMFLQSIGGNVVKESIDESSPMIAEQKKVLNISSVGGDIKVLYKGKNI